MLEIIKEWSFAVLKVAAIAAFICMDFTHSFPDGSWAQLFDRVFNVALIVYFVACFIDVLISAKVTK